MLPLLLLLHLRMPLVLLLTCEATYSTWHVLDLLWFNALRLTILLLGGHGLLLAKRNNQYFNKNNMSVGEQIKTSLTFLRS